MIDSVTFEDQLRACPAAGAGWGGCFSAAEVERLHRSRRAVDPARAPVVLCAFECPRYARAGGVAVVLQELGEAFLAVGREVVLLTPLHRKLPATRAATDRGELVPCAELTVPFGGGVLGGQLWRRLGGGPRMVFIDLPPCFDADVSPYLLPEEPGAPDRLLGAALAFSAAIPWALQASGLGDGVLVALQDWQAAPAAIALKEAVLAGRLGSVATLLCSHNPYDRYLPDEALAALTARAVPGRTAYQRAIPLLDAPLATVSRAFAADLRADPLMTGVFADHLQDAYATVGLVGVDNPPFGRAAVPASVLDAARGGDLSPLAAWKDARRGEALAVLDAYRPPAVLGRIASAAGGPAADLGDEPVFLMFGRLDPRQKGFDLTAEAIRRLPRGLARFVLTPNLEGQDPAFLQALAEERPGEVVVYPFLMERGYQELQRGASFLLFPSLFEPFGGASEGSLQGTPVLARATGGLTQQIRPLGGPDATGLLFREPARADAAFQWRRLMDHVALNERRGLPLFEDLVFALAAAMAEAAALFREDRAGYLRLIAAGVDAVGAFSRARAAAEWSRLFARATENGDHVAGTGVRR